MRKLLNIFYIFSYVEWILFFIIIFGDHYLFKHVANTYMPTLEVLMTTCCLAILVVWHFSAELDRRNLYKYRCKYKVNKLTLNNITYYIPVIIIWTTWGHRYERVIYNVESYHVSLYSPYSIRDAIREKNYRMPDKFRKFCYKTEEEAYYEIAQCKKYILSKKATNTGSMKSKDINVNFK